MVRMRLGGVLLGVLAATAYGQMANTNTPRIGYLYPAGGQQGTVVRVVAGGQFLRGAEQVVVSGPGVQATVLEVLKPFRPPDRAQRELLQQRLREVRDRRLAELRGATAATTEKPTAGKNRRRQHAPEAARNERRATAPKKKATADPPNPTPRTGKADATPKKKAAADPPSPTPPTGKADAAGKPAEVTLPSHPLLYDLDSRSLRELAHIVTVLHGGKGRKQQNRQLGESVIVELRIAADAAPGLREIRLLTAAGLTNPLVFEVGTQPETSELEPNGEMDSVPALLRDKVPPTAPLTLPVVVNGQIMPGDIDRFRFRAEAGQQLVIATQARRLIPYLADAVPGWFQATVSLYDAAGAEVAFADDFRFDPDPVLYYQVPATGEYEVEIRDSIFRGREDFVYRIAIGQQPFITQMFPLGGRAGAAAVAQVDGWNLARGRIALDTQAETAGYHEAMVRQGRGLANPVAYAVDTLPECMEKDQDDPEEAQAVRLPMIVNGVIAADGDVDRYEVRGHAGQTLVAEVAARRLGSPLDALVRVRDATGAVLGWNDDFAVQDKGYLFRDVTGLTTHHADSYLQVELPANGAYQVEIADAQGHGGAAYAYRLRLSEPRPDFALRVTPASVTVRAGASVPVTVYALRADGFAGAIGVRLADKAGGFVLSGERIPAGRDQVTLTLTAPRRVRAEVVQLNLVGEALIDGRPVQHRAVPAEDTMQAFLYRHLVPAQQWVVAVQQGRFRAPEMALATAPPVRVPAGGAAEVALRAGRGLLQRPLEVELRYAPEGITLAETTMDQGHVALTLQADENVLAAGYADNLIVEAFTEFTPKNAKGSAAQPRRVSVGVFPAIPFEVVAQ